MDCHSKAVRSYNMSKIRYKDTKPEEIVRKYLFSRGLRFRKNVKNLPGKPDIVLKKYKTVVFVNGCFWHGHENCRYFVMPKSNTLYWNNKIYKNKMRDKYNCDMLRKMNWNVLIVWECELKRDKRDSALGYLYDNIINNLNL